MRQYDSKYVEVTGWGSADRDPPTMIYKQRIGDITVTASTTYVYLYDEFFDRLLSEKYDSAEQFVKRAEALQDIVKYKPVDAYSNEELNTYFKHVSARVMQADEVMKNLELVDEVNSCSLKKRKSYNVSNRMILNAYKI